MWTSKRLQGLNSKHAGDDIVSLNTKCVTLARRWKHTHTRVQTHTQLDKGIYLNSLSQLRTISLSFNWEFVNGHIAIISTLFLTQEAQPFLIWMYFLFQPLLVILAVQNTIYYAVSLIVKLVFVYHIILNYYYYKHTGYSINSFAV